jgi:hypothetical protein
MKRRSISKLVRNIHALQIGSQSHLRNKFENQIDRQTRTTKMESRNFPNLSFAAMIVRYQRR